MTVVHDVTLKIRSETLVEIIAHIQDAPGDDTKANGHLNSSLANISFGIK